MPYGQIDSGSGRMDNWSDHGQFGGSDDSEGRTYECEAHDCRHHDTSVDNDGDMERCPDCEGWHCPAHRVLSEKGNEELCFPCAESHRQDRLSGGE